MKHEEIIKDILCSKYKRMLDFFKKIKNICANGCVFITHSGITCIYSTPNRAESWNLFGKPGLHKKKNPGNLGLVIYFVSKILNRFTFYLYKFSAVLNPLVSVFTLSPFNFILRDHF